MPKIITHHLTFELLPHETLLQGLERTGHAVEYQCKSGYCGACRLKLLSGSVSCAQRPMAFIADGEILPCCCQVKTDICVDCIARLPENIVI